MVQVKSNLAPTGSAILFEVAEKGVDFISEMEMTAEEAFQSLAPKMGRPNDRISFGNAERRRNAFFGLRRKT